MFLVELQDSLAINLTVLAALCALLATDRRQIATLHKYILHKTCVCRHRYIINIYVCMYLYTSSVCVLLCVRVWLMADIVDKFQVKNSENIYDLTFV